MKIDIESIKDAVYEFEGLLELAELREDKLQALLPLMKKKLDLINTLFNGSADEVESVSVDEDDEPVSLDIISAYDEKEDAPTEVNIVSLEKISEEEDMPADEETPANEEPVFVASEDGDEPEEKLMRSKLFADQSGPKPAFCINDRFRFRRELFDDSDTGFNSAMDLVATMDDYEEAEDYFIGELGWDIEKPEVMDFMAIIRNYFDK